MLVIHTFENGLSGVRAHNADVKLGIGRDPELSAPVLIVDYPAPTGDPAGRDVSCDAENRDWRAGSALSFRIKPSHAVKLSVSFLDANGVAYTSWTDLQGGVWQTVRIPFDRIRPNPYFQPPDAKQGAAIDVNDVSSVAFAPHDETPGRLAVGAFIVVE